MLCSSGLIMKSPLPTTGLKTIGYWVTSNQVRKLHECYICFDDNNKDERLTDVMQATRSRNCKSIAPAV